MVTKIMNWFDDRLPLTATIERHLTKYPAPINMNIWYLAGVLLVVVLVIPVGVCSATTVAPGTLTLPLIPDVVSTSEKIGRLRQKTDEKRSILFKIGFIINPKIN